MGLFEHTDGHSLLFGKRHKLYCWLPIASDKLMDTRHISGTERVQTLADISRSALCCHSNETRAPIAYSPNSAPLEGTLYHFSKLHPGPRSTEEMTDRHTDTQTAVANIHFASATPHTKCKYT